MVSEALDVDSNFFSPMMGLSNAYNCMGMLEDNLSWVIKCYNKKDRWPINVQLMAGWTYNFSFGPPEEAASCLRQLLIIDDSDPGLHWALGTTYTDPTDMQWDKAIAEYEKGFELFHKRFGKEYLKDGGIYHLLDAYLRASIFQGSSFNIKRIEKLLKEAEHYCKGADWITATRAEVAMREKNISLAGRYMDEFFKMVRKKYPDYSNKMQTIDSAWIYLLGGMRDKARLLFRNAVNMDTTDNESINNYIDFISNFYDREDSADFIKYIDRVSVSYENKTRYCLFLDRKGWGLYKYGKHQDALKLLQEVWDEAPFRLYVFRYHLDEVKKAIENQDKGNPI
jgi:tetratricopeptide (TPR) repeat protein